MVKSKILFIEGSRDQTNGDLREGFKVLFEKELEGQMPKIIMGNGKSEAIDKFLHLQTDSRHFKNVIRFLLIDLDKEEKHRNTDLANNKLTKFSHVSFYMIQEMEAWFISQNSVLDKYYGVKVSAKIPKKKAIAFSDPKAEIRKWLRPFRMEYREVRDGIELLKKLDLNQLQKDFPDVNNLIKALSKK